MNKRVFFGGMLAISSLFVLQGSAPTFAEEIEPVTATTNFTLTTGDPVLQVTVPTSPTVLDLTPTASGTAFGSVIVNTKVSTNNMTGYTLTMTANPTALTRTEAITISGEETTPTIPTLSSSTTEANFPADKWGYKITGEAYNPITTPAIWTTEEPTNSTDNNITLAAKVSVNTPSGAYQTTLNYQAVTNAIISKDIITFNKNNNDATGTMADFVVLAGSTSFLPLNTFTAPEGYKFAGWATTPSGLVEGNNKPKYYPDGARYIMNFDHNRTTTLYAQWEPDTIPKYCDLMPDECGSSGSDGVTIARAYEIAYTAMHKGMYEEQHEGEGDYALVNSWPPTSEPYKNYDVRFAMQDMTPEICDSVTVLEDSYKALDVRDNHLYYIAKLKDGRCWLQDALDLDLTDENVQQILSSSNTNASDESLGYLINGGGAANNQYSILGVKEWTLNYYGYYVDYGSAQVCTKYRSDAADWWDAVGYRPEESKIGTFYNFCAASAGSYCFGQGRSSAGDPIDDPASIMDAKEDICPTGWRLPTDSRTADSRENEYAYLLSLYAPTSTYSGGSRPFRAALRLSFPGYINNDQRAVLDGYFFTSTYSDSTDMNMFRISSNVNANRIFLSLSRATRAGGYSVRCVAK